MTSTPGDADIPLLKSGSLGPPGSWKTVSTGLLNGTKIAGSPPGSSLQVEGHHYCDIWSPVLVAPPAPPLAASSSSSQYAFAHNTSTSSSRGTVGGTFQLLFSARRFDAAQTPCPPMPFPYNGAIYQGIAGGVVGPYTSITALGAAQNCTNPRAPRALPTAGGGCGETGECDLVIRLGPELYTEAAPGRLAEPTPAAAAGNAARAREAATWMAYEWYTFEPPRWQAEEMDSGEHISIVKMDAAAAAHSPFAPRASVDCASPTVMNITSPKDPWLMNQLQNYCPRCGEMLSFVMGRYVNHLCLCQMQLFLFESSIMSISMTRPFRFLTWFFVNSRTLLELRIPQRNSAAPHQSAPSPCSVAS